MYSRIWGATAAALVLAFAAANLGAAQARPLLASIESALTAVVLAVSICYTPDYLHLTVDKTKRQRWEIKIRWRVIGAVLVLGLLSVSSITAALALLAAIAWLTAANLLARKLQPRDCSLYFWTTDFLLVAGLLLSGRLSPLVGAILLAAAAHLSILISEKALIQWTIIVTALSSLLLMILRLRGSETTSFFLAAGGLLVVSAGATAWLVWRAQRHNASNVQAAIDELVRFTGYPAETVWHLWSASNQELAKNWQSAAVDESDAVRLAEWYRKNSRLYMFAISAYNLEYKRIRSNLKVLRFARGSTLDYGAGNGEILLELARRGHRVTYYDVEGETMKFARQRALEQGLDVEFCHTKECLAASARVHRFDTVFSFDVLEHLPDLPAELTFLSSLLNSGGLFLFDVPAGSTKAHPMHLNHNLGVREHMKELGLHQERSFLQRLSFRKEEKFFFRK